MSCKVFFGEELFRLDKGIYECCAGLKRVLVFSLQAGSVAGAWFEAQA
jgi:hypothetical protein